MTRVAVVGQVVVDQIVRGTRSLSSDPWAFDDTSIGGKAFNIAAAAARFGADVELVTAVGNDSEGRRALEEIEKLGIGFSYVRYSGARSGRVVGTPVQRTFPVTAAEEDDIKTPRVRLTEGRYGEREVQLLQDPGMGDFYRAAVMAIDPKAFDVIIFTLEFEDSVLRELGNVMQRTPLHKRRLPLIVANPAPSRLTPAVVQVLNMAHALTPNRFEAATLVGKELDHDPSADTAERLTQIYGKCEWAAVTYGAQGWAWASRERGASSGTDGLPSLGVRDKIGASDVYTAVVALMKCNGASIEAATLAAGVAARIAVARAGGASRFPALKEIERDLGSLPHPSAGSAVAGLQAG